MHGLLRVLCYRCNVVFSPHSSASYLSYFPTLLLFQDVQIVSTDENQVFLALQEWYQSDTYNLYQSDPQGVYYSIVLENVRSTKQPEENVLIDILEVKNLSFLVPFVTSPWVFSQRSEHTHPKCCMRSTSLLGEFWQK